MKMFKWSLLVVVFIVGFVVSSPCMASDIQSDDTVMTDEDSAYDSEQYAEPEMAQEEYNDDGEMYNDNDSNEPESGDDYAEGPEEATDEEAY